MSATILLEVPEISTEKVHEIFKSQQLHTATIAKTSYRERIKKLKSLKDWIENNRSAIEQAIYNDFKKPPTATVTTELATVFSEISHATKHLKSWMEPTHVGAPLPLLGTSSYIQYEPKGVCLIISPWNYPFSLAINPLISAIAAGNTSIIKPSEMTPNTSAILQQMMDELFQENEIAVIQGGVDVSQDLLSKPFNHIFFTGSPKVGKIVMRAAADSLASVTLELGGKSPAIVDKTADLYASAEKLVWGKLINNGQTCIAPDYILANEAIENKLIQNLEKLANKMFNADGNGIQKSPDYARIVNNKNFNRLKSLLEDAINKGAKVAFGGDLDEADLFISPTVLTNVTAEMDIMQEEIFGPILPIMTYSDNEDALHTILDLPKPLSLYVFTKSRKTEKFFLEKTSSGSVVVNDCLIQYAQTNLPFGGINNSGFGNSGGHFGFLQFSHSKAVVKQKFAQTQLLYPPYSGKVKTVVDWLLKLV